MVDDDDDGSSNSKEVVLEEYNDTTTTTTTTNNNVGDDGEEQQHMTNNHDTNTNHMYLPFRHDMLQLQQLYNDATATTTTATTNGRMDNNDNEQKQQQHAQKNCGNDSHHQGLGGGCKEKNCAMNATCDVDDVVESNNILHHDVVHNEMNLHNKPSSTSQDLIDNIDVSSTNSSIVLNKQSSDTSSHSNTTTQRRNNTLTTVGQLKMALLFEASIVHQGSGGNNNDGHKCIFNKYWNTMVEYLCTTSSSSSRRRHHHHLHIQSDPTSATAAAVDFETMLHNFLITRKMKRLHNKLILGKTLSL
jgi:hypothetical protein